MKIKRLELLAALEVVRAAVASKEMIPQSDCFIFLPNTLCAFNGDVLVSCPTEIDLECAVKADTFYNFIKASQVKEIDIEQIDLGFNKLVVKAGKGRAVKFVTEEVIIPIDEIPECGEETGIVPDELLEALSFAAFSASDDYSTILTNILVTDKEVVATDQSRVTVRKFDGDKPEYLLPATVVRSLVALEPTEYQCDPEWMHFINDADVVMTVRLGDGDFPDYEALLDIDGVELEFPAKLTDALQTSEIFLAGALKQDKLVELELADGVLTVKCNGANGSFTEEVEMDTDEEFSFRIDPRVLIEAIKLGKGATMTVGENTILIEGDNFQHVLCLS